MNLELIFKRFDDLADAPERIPALRNFVFLYLLHSTLNLPNAISIAETLREAHLIRRRENTRKANRKEVPTVLEVTEEDLPPSLSNIPPSLFDRLGNVSSVEKGLSQIQSTRPGKYPLVVTAETRSSSESYDFEGAAVIVPLVSSTGHGHASLKRLHYQDGRFAVGNILAVVKPICPDLLGARFIYEYLVAFKEELLVSRMVGTANVSLTVNKLKEVPVPLVSGLTLSRLDELMALCDRLEAQQQDRDIRQAVLARAALSRFGDNPTVGNLGYLFHPAFSIAPGDLRKAILTLAVRGKLVEQDAGEEPIYTSFPELRNLDCRDNQHSSLPTSWCVASYRSLTSLVTSGSRGWKDYYSDSGAIFIRTQNINTDKLVLDDVAFVSLPDSAEGKRSMVLEGDILITITGANVTKAALVETELPEAYISQHIALTRLRWSALSKWLHLCFVSPGAARGQLEKLAYGDKPGLNLDNIRNLKIPLPPLAEQQRIVAKVDQLMALVDELETQLTKSKAAAARVLEAVVRGLSGNLASTGKLESKNS